MGMTDTLKFNDVTIEDGYILITKIRIVPYYDKVGGGKGDKKYHFKIDYAFKSARDKSICHKGQYSGDGFDESDINITRFNEILMETTFPNSVAVFEEGQGN